jgi:DNA repair protein RecO (recombination protein O)
MRVTLQPAYVIHSRPYRDSSALLDVFTAEHGRISLVARGARRQQRRGGSAALLQPFTPLLLSFSGHSQLKSLVATESARPMLSLRGDRLFSGLYLNELLVRLLHRNDSHPTLFAAYDRALQALESSAAVDTVLRQFELTLLDELGYGFDPGLDAVSGEAIQAANWYRYEPGIGLVEASEGGRGSAMFSGEDLLALASGDFGGPARLAAKRLLREALAAHLGGEPLRSRELFRTATPGVAKGCSAATGDGSA